MAGFFMEFKGKEMLSAKLGTVRSQRGSIISNFKDMVLDPS
jgi:hypothetical protein